MRWFLTFCGLFLGAANAGPAFNGVWVLDLQHSHFADSNHPQGVLLRIEDVAPGWITVLEISTDAHGRHVQLSEHQVDQSAAEERAQLVLRDRTTGGVNTWTVTAAGWLIIEAAPRPDAAGRERLVFKPAELRPLSQPKRRRWKL